MIIKLRTSVLARLLAVPFIVAGHAASASFEGTYNYLGYHIEFHSGIIPSHGETKSIETGYSTINVSSGNTFTSIFRNFMMERKIENYYTSDPEPRCINTYAANISLETQAGAGSYESAENLVLNIIPGDEPDLTIPLYFSRNTNVALNIEGTTADYPNECGFGLLVRQGATMDNGDLNGTYIRYTLGNIAHQEAPGNFDGLSLERATMEFDGDGNYTENTRFWQIFRITGETNLLIGSDTIVQTYNVLSDADESVGATNGTYTLLPDGTLAISSDIGSITNQLSPDANLAASPLAIDLAPSLGTFYTVVLKQPENMPTNGVDAVYFLTEWYEEFFSETTSFEVNYNIVSLTRAYLFLDSDGTFHIRYDYWDVENVMRNEWSDYDQGPATNLVSRNVFSTVDSERTIGFDDGTYAIQTNGVLTLHFAEDDMVEVQLSENGEYLVFGYADAGEDYAERAVGVGIRRTTPAPAPSPVVFNNDMEMTTTGIVMTASVPINYPIEGLYTDDLSSGDWYSGGYFTNSTGTLLIHDSSATNEVMRFYSATFVPW